MSEHYPLDRKYTKDHEWAYLKNNTVIIGITWYAQSKLKDIVYIELPKIGKKINKSETIAVIESVKTAAEVYSPISGEIIEVNKELENSPELLNKDPYNKGWIAKIKPLNLEKEWKELLSVSEYKKLIE